VALFGGAMGKDTVSRVWRKAKGDWDAWNARLLADEPIVRLILDGTVVRVRLDKQATSISLLVALSVRQDGQKVLQHGQRERSRLAGARRSRQTRPKDAGTRHCRWRVQPRESSCRALERHACPALHRAQESQSFGPCARPAARGNFRRLQGYDLRRNEAGEGVHPQMAAETPRGRADSLEEAGDKLFTFTRFPKSQWKSIRTSNAIERLHEKFKRRIKTQTVLPSAETAAMLFWALLASGQITMRKADGWQSLAEKPCDQIIDLAA
jgi:putative transposase